jgi:hypothetical protein
VIPKMVPTLPRDQTAMRWSNTEATKNVVAKPQE